MSNWDIY